AARRKRRARAASVRCVAAAGRRDRPRERRHGARAHTGCDGGARRDRAQREVAAGCARERRRERRGAGEPAARDRGGRVAMAPERSAERRFELLITGAALVVILLGCAVVLRPFVTSLLWAVVLWLSTASLHQQVLSWVGGRRTIAALLMTLGVAL